MKLEMDRLNNRETRAILVGFRSDETGANQIIDIVSKVQGSKLVSRFIVTNKGDEIMEASDLELAVDCLNALK